ncbi:hypothetical protein ACHAXN_010601 [Cyclotella atomus]
MTSRSRVRYDIELLCLGGDDLHQSNDGKSSHIICQSTNKTNHHPLNCSTMSKLLQLLTLSQALSIASARRLNESQPDNSRIIGGKEAVAGRFPYAVALSDSVGQFCGGSLIAEDVVLTAAHCQGSDYNIVVGRHDLSDESLGEAIPVS